MTDEHLALCLRENEVAVTPPPLQIKQGGGRPRSQVWQHFTACGDRNDKSRRFIVSCNACGQNLSSRVEAMEKHVAYDCKEVPEEGRLMIQQKIAGKTAVAGTLAIAGAPAQKKPKTPKIVKQQPHLPHHHQQLQPPSTLICRACGVQYPPTPDPQPCRICCDERQYVPRSGQSWTTMEKMVQEGYKNCFQKHEPRLYGIGTVPKFGIGQRAFLIQTPNGNLLWDCISLVDDATVDIIKALGGLRAIAISHPHYYASNAQWSAAFEGVPVYIHERDKEWVVWEHGNINYWGDHGDSLPLWGGFTLLHLGGHFAGAQVLHWANGADGKGALFTGDVLQVGMDRETVSVMRSYPNYIPLSPAYVDRLSKKIENWHFHRLYGAFWDMEIESDAKSKVAYSLERYIKWIIQDEDLEI